MFLEGEGNGGPHNGDRVGIRCGDRGGLLGMASGGVAGFLWQIYLTPSWCYIISGMCWGCDLLKGKCDAGEVVGSSRLTTQRGCLERAACWKRCPAIL